MKKKSQEAINKRNLVPTSVPGFLEIEKANKN